MDTLKIFLVGGFLGSGKTTAIQQAVQYLYKNKKKAGVITNDQGDQQVDTGFIKGLNIPAEEVSGGCFCCNYDALGERIAALKTREQPDVIFAESVGTCTDVAATVINPLLSFNPGQYEIVLSVFADIRLLVKFLQDDKGIFYDNVNYIYEMQLEEADVIIVNKIDLLNEEKLELAKQLIESAYGGKKILYQDSLSVESIEKWVTLIYDFKDPSLRHSLDIDYDIYGAGEAELAWLDEEIGIVTKEKNAVAAGCLLVNKIYDKIANEGHPVGHLKFLMNNGLEQRKISFTSLASAAEADEDFMEADRVILLVNARVQVSPSVLQEIVEDAIAETEVMSTCKIIENKLSVFQPGYPRPTHRVVA